MSESSRGPWHCERPAVYLDHWVWVSMGALPKVGLSGLSTPSYSTLAGGSLAPAWHCLSVCEEAASYVDHERQSRQLSSIAATCS